MSNTIEGIWHSHYEYGKGSSNELQTSNHRVKFTQDNKGWIGKSLPNDEGSELTITIWQNGNEFKGKWYERTSPTGNYSGREFSGAILLLQTSDNELNGMWLGADNSAQRVKSGIWTLKRER